MNRVHRFIIGYLRTEITNEGSDSVKLLIDLPDAALARQMFKNMRGQGETAKGLMLSSFGLRLMMVYFKSYEIEIPGEGPLGPRELLYLDRRAKLPYYIHQNGNLTMFDADLSIKLKLSDGDIATLAESDSFFD